MKKLLEYRTVILFLALVGLGGLGYLAAGLRTLQFRPPEPLGFDFGGPVGQPGLGAVTEIPIWQILALAAILTTLVVLIMLLVDPETRKRLLLLFLRYALTFAVLWWVMNNIALKNAAPELPEGPPAPFNGAGALGETPPVYAPSPVSPWLVFGVSLALALLFALIGWSLYRRFQKQKSFAPLGEIAGIARRAIDDLGDGHNWDEAIVQCYLRMSQAVTAQRGLIRKVDMTPSEFAARMERSGLPGEAARTLTRLFEQVRYGGITPTQADRNTALAALNAILRACGAMP
jgi:hypothetical protein